MSFLSDLGSLQRQLESSFQTMFGGMRSFSPANTQFDGVSENSTALAVSGGIGGVGGGGGLRRQAQEDRATQSGSWTPVQGQVDSASRLILS